MTAPGDPRARIDALFDEALALPREARAAFLDAATKGEPALRAEIDELLRLADAPSPVLEPGALQRDALWRQLQDGEPEPPADDDAGREVGGWKLLRELGRGGMGAVHLAKRVSGDFEQYGALKLIRRGIDSEAFLRRFARERQILASFNHPGIARLLDGGRDADGRPYLVMEFVDGEPIDRHCDRHHLDVAARVSLFLQVARAVAHAHRHLVVHRDLKPSNILVDAEGGVKLLDFGIAKMLSADDGAEAVRTGDATRIFTPDYAAPEQRLGKPATTGVDVYQLGLLLHELLTGRRAFPSDGDAAALQRAVDGAEPPPPGSRDAEPTACAVRDTTPAALRRKLRGDLDTIVLKALRAQPERRYATAAALADDIERWQQGRPILARPETFGYRAGKFLRRHPFGAAGALASLLLLVAYAVTATMQANAIARERDRARAEAAKAQQVKALALRLFENADPQQSGNSQLSARELLDRGWAGIEAELGDQPEVRIELLDTVAEAYRQLGLYDEAQPLLDASIDTATALRASHPELLARALRSKGRLRNDQGDHAEAGRLFGEALEAYRGIHAGDHEDIAATLADLGMMAFGEGDWKEAERLHREALAMRRRLFGEEHLAVADSLDQLGISIRHQGDYAAAEPLLARALAQRRRLLPSEHPLLARSLSNLALARSDLGDDASAEALYREALAMMARSHGEGHLRVATIKNNLARVLQVRRDLPGAIALLREALQIRRDALGERHPDVALNLNDLGRLLADAGDDAAALAHYRRALDAYPPDHPWRSATVFNMGLLAEERGELDAAERHYRDALAQQRRDYGEEHDRVATDLVRLGAVLHRQGRLDEAEARLREGLAIYRKRLPAGHRRLAPALSALAALLPERGRRDEAGPLLREAWTINRDAFGDDDPRTADAADALARFERH